MELHRQIAQRLNDGVIEVKAVWVEHDAVRRNELTAALARIFVHSLKLTDARYAFCMAASHAVPRWQSSGGVVSADVTAVPYPDERYQTSLMWWDPRTVFQLISGEQIRTILRESGQLFQGLMAARSGSASVT